MDLTELNPPSVIAPFDGHALELRNFDLRAIVWATHYFATEGKNGLNMMNTYLNNHKNFDLFSGVVSEIIWHLMPDDDREDIYQDSSCYFKRLILETPEKDGGPERAIAVFFDAIQKVFSNSFPDPPESVNTQEGQKPKQQQESTPECWAKIFIEVSSYIKCNLDEFYAFTTRQIDTFRTQINALKAENLGYQAMAMQPGVKFNASGGTNHAKKDIFTDDDIKEIMADQKIFMEQFPA